jgi:c-di-GMP-binding flagellar brake protein YcgR
MRVNVLTSSERGGAQAIEAVVRRVGVDHIALGVPRLPEAASTIGAPVKISAQLHGRIYALDATVLGLEESPRALVVSIPIEARRAERRNYYRLNCNLEAYASWDGFDARLEPLRFHRQPVRLLDISGGGALMRTRERIPTHAVVELEFALEGVAESLTVLGRAIRVEQEERSASAFRINTEFEGVANRTQEQIIRFIFRQQALRTQRRSQ